MFSSVVLGGGGGGGGGGNSMFGLGASFLQFPKIVQKDSIAANCESQMLLGKYLSAADKK